jgi:serine/threonine protein phosphatase PrpC
MNESADQLKGDGATDVGTVRQRNEDAFLCRDDLGLWAVADGAGGHGAGDVAAAEAIAALASIPAGLTAAELLAQVRMRLQSVHRELRRQATADAGGAGGMMATTIVVLLARSEHMACLWAGDSRAYRLRGGAFTPLTRDHSLVQELVDQGALAAEAVEGHPKANVVTRALGAGEEVELDKVLDAAEPGDVYLLCTDGLTKALSDEEIRASVEAAGGARDLVERALRAGARDNVTAVVVRAPGA